MQAPIDILRRQGWLWLTNQTDSQLNALLGYLGEVIFTTVEAIELFEHKVFEDDRSSIPLVTKDGMDIKFYYSFWLVRDEDRSNPALIAFQDNLRNMPYHTVSLGENDVLVVDNHRVLHGRTAIEGSKDRHLKRYWIKELSNT